MKMYTNKPKEIVESTSLPAVTDDKKKIKTLEDEVRQLKEQVHKMAAALSLNSRQIRRQNTDIHNVTTALRSHK